MKNKDVIRQNQTIIAEPLIIRYRRSVFFNVVPELVGGLQPYLVRGGAGRAAWTAAAGLGSWR